ncbi:uncharacterized protein LOC106660496 [Trichogramma pretiosum]|uniref:uncharacterized protein LOC106660496 n=1 Tax=Trichogramma pretiosum TaxID=7493 RepID=UPI0006C9911B|nr:uncharacterized protein LOC106660496 [Trichogramma pretiosum]
MNHSYEKNCECKNNYDSTSIELLNYESGYYPSSSCRSRLSTGFRCVFNALVILGLAYALWRVHAIDETLGAHEKLDSVTQLIRHEHGRARFARSLKAGDSNGFEASDKQLPRGSLPSSKNEPAPVATQKPALAKDTFEDMVNALFYQIRKMHNDTERSNFDNNMKAVFQAWFPVFEALLPSEISSELRDKRQAPPKSSEESSEEKKPRA